MFPTENHILLAVFSRFRVFFHSQAEKSSFTLKLPANQVSMRSFPNTQSNHLIHQRR